VSYLTRDPALFRIAPALLLLAACVVPSDQSDSVFVTINSGSAIVSRGGALTLQARAWRGSPDGSAVLLGGTSFVWSSSDSAIAGVTPGPGGRAVVSGLSSGMVVIRASAKDFEDAAPVEVGIRVANTVEIDQVTPERVRFGEQVTVSGVGLGKVERVFLGDAPLIPDSASFTGDSTGIGSMRFWVAYPASSQRLLAVATEGFSASAPDTTFVVPEDVYERPDGLPAMVSLDGPVVRQPDVLFYNPALALELGSEGDSLRFFRSDTSTPLTITIRTASPRTLGFEPSISPDGPSLFGPAWSVGAQVQQCRSTIYNLPSIPPDSVMRVVEGSASSAFRVGVSGPAAGYSIVVRRGRPVPDSRIAPDRFEPNDQCEAADHNSLDPDLRLDLAASFLSEVMTIDYPYDLDWYHFSVPEGASQLVTIRTAALPFGAADSSDVGIYLLDRFETIATAAAPGSTETIALEVGAGDYYLVVADEAGVPTRYALCIALGTACMLPSAVALGDVQLRPPASAATGAPKHGESLAQK
jgi:Bacterial pre-peptidase C-terminal domain